MGTYRTVSQIAVDISKYGSVGALLLHDIIIPPPRRRETSTVCLSVCPSSTRNKYFRLIFLRNYWCQTLHIWCAASASGPTPRLPNLTLVQYSPLNRFPTFKKKFLSILEMDLSFGVYWDVPVRPSRVFPTEFTQENPEKLRLFSEQKKTRTKIQLLTIWLSSSSQMRYLIYII